MELTPLRVKNLLPGNGSQPGEWLLLATFRLLGGQAASLKAFKDAACPPNNRNVASSSHSPGCDPLPGSKFFTRNGVNSISRPFIIIISYG